MSIEILPDTAQLRQETTTALQRAQGMAIACNADLQLGADFLRGIKTIRKKLDETFDPVIEAAHKSHKAALAAKAQHDRPLAEAEQIVKRKVGIYTQEQERIRQEEERRLREEARKAEEERLLAEAEEMEAAGNTEEAEAIIAAPVVAPPVVLAKTTPKLEGVSTRQAVKFRVVAPNAVPRQFCEPSDKRIRAHVLAFGMATKIDGVEVYEEDIVSAKGF